MIEIILKGEPKSTGHIYKFTCRGSFPSMYMNKEGKSLKESYQWQVKSQYKGKPLKGDISLEVELYFGTKRRQDIDNFNKLIYDALTGIVWEDDSQITDVWTKKLYDKKDPRVVLRIVEMEGFDNKLVKVGSKLYTKEQLGSYQNN